MKLFCLGDSLTFGFGVPHSQRWTALLERDGYQVFNYGVSGDTTAGMLSRLKTDIVPSLPLALESRACCRVLLMGRSNDIFYSGSDTAARANIGAGIHQLLALKVEPVIGIPLPVAAHLTPVSWHRIVDFSSAAYVLEVYGDWLKEFCKAFGIFYVDFRADFLSENGQPQDNYFLDGIHPNAEGHRLMAQRLERQLNEDMTRSAN